MSSPQGYLTVGEVPRHYGCLHHIRDRQVLIADDQAFTWAYIDKASTQVANALLGQRLRPGSKIVVLLPNCVEYVEIIYGFAKAGFVIVPLNPRLVAREVEYCTNFSDAEAVVTTSTHFETMRSILPALERVEEDRVLLLDADPPIGRSYYAMRDAAPISDPGIKVDENDLYWMPFTSGTTGLPKAAMVRHRDLVEHWNIVVREFNATPEDTILIAGPFYHSLGFVFALTLLYIGGRVIIQSEYIPERSLHAIQQHRISIVVMVPTMYTMLLANSSRSQYDLKSMKTVISAGSPLLTGTKEGLLEMFPNAGLYEFYGATEMGITSKLHPTDQRRKVRSVGQPILGVDVRLLDDDGNDVPQGEVGEIYKRGLLLGPEYYKNPEATKSQFPGEWMSAGDLGRFDEEGYLYIVDRKKDMIITGGVNVYPAEVEEFISKHPSVLEVAVIGVPDEKWGEAVKAVVVPRPGNALNTDEIMRFCVDGLASHKRPRSIDVVETLPKGGTGKILKRELRERYWQGQDTWVH